MSKYNPIQDLTDDILIANGVCGKQISSHFVTAAIAQKRQLSYV